MIMLFLFSRKILIVVIIKVKQAIITLKLSQEIYFTNSEPNFLLILSCFILYKTLEKSNLPITSLIFSMLKLTLAPDGKIVLMLRFPDIGQ